MRNRIIFWSLIGLLIRLAIMPFSFHGHDIFFINHPAFEFIEKGAWNPYLYLSENFASTADISYYPPFLFLIMAAFLFLQKFLLANLSGLFSLYEFCNFTWEGNTINFADMFLKYQLFRTLFVFKVPYLLFDFLTGWLLFKLLKGFDKNKALLAYIIWMFNPFVLHSCYALGQIDIITTFFIVACIYFILLKKRYLAMGVLSLGVLTKIFPVLLVPFAILLTADKFKDRAKLLLIFFIPLILLIAPFYIPAPKAFVDSVLFSPGGIPEIRRNLFLIGYSCLLILCFFKRKDEKTNEARVDFLIAASTIVFLIFFSFYIVTIRYFVMVTPLLIYLGAKNKKLWPYLAIFTVSLFMLRTAGNSQQWGLFAALHPEFFTSLPILDSYLNLLINVKLIHQFMYRLFFASSLVMALHILINNKHNLKFFGIKNEKS